MSNNVEIINIGDPRIARLTSEIIEKIENDLPDSTLVVSVIGMLEIIKQHYVSRGVDKGEQG